jgi:hypothetical protein
VDVRCALLLIPAVAVALAACGGGGSDKSDAEQTVKDFVDAVGDRDAGKFCGELVTQEFLEQTTVATGQKAESECESELKTLKGLDVKLVRIKKTTVKDDRASVRATLEAQGETRDQVLRLKKEDGRFKLAGGSGG